MIKQPCEKACPRRKVGCHSSCRDYIVFRLLKDIEIEKKKKENDAKPLINKRTMEYQWKLMKKNRYKRANYKQD